jgi:hypothetical protein
MVPFLLPKKLELGEEVYPQMTVITQISEEEI